MVSFDPIAHAYEFGLNKDESTLTRQGANHLGFLGLTPAEMEAYGQYDLAWAQQPEADPLWVPIETVSYVSRAIQAGLEVMKGRYRNPENHRVYWHYSTVCQQAINQLVEHQLIERPETL